MNMHESYVSLETAKLLKKTGFDWECKKIHFKTGWKGNDDVWKLEDNNKKTKLVLELDYCLLAPTLEVAQRWLREVKEMHIVIEHVFATKRYFVSVQWSISEGMSRTEFIRDAFNTYEEAQEAGIKKVLELILERGE